MDAVAISVDYTRCDVEKVGGAHKITLTLEGKNALKFLGQN